MDFWGWVLAFVGGIGVGGLGSIFVVARFFSGMAAAEHSGNSDAGPLPRAQLHWHVAHTRDDVARIIGLLFVTNSLLGVLIAIVLIRG